MTGPPIVPPEECGTDENASQDWPTLYPEARYGLAGYVVDTLEPHSEADPAALLTTFLTAFGSAVGPGPHCLADGAQHPARLNTLIVGRTSRARKGTSEARIRSVMGHADPAFASDQILSGLASGEGVIAAVRNPDENEEAEGKIKDKRVLCMEPEFARVLKACSRDGSTLSAVIRSAWDRGDLGVLTRKDPLRATGAHISIVAHITVEELRRHLEDTEVANGFMNRFLIVCAKRSKKLPEGGNLDDADVAELGELVSKAIKEARRFGRLRRTKEARELWSVIYNEIDDEREGILGAVTARAEAQMLRLSVVFALLDRVDVVEVHHLQAAHAVWRYCEQSAAYVFGGTVGDVVVDRLYAALLIAGSQGLDGTAQHELFGRHLPAARLERARRWLEGRGVIVTEQHSTGGRPRLISYAKKAN